MLYGGGTALLRHPCSRLKADCRSLQHGDLYRGDARTGQSYRLGRGLGDVDVDAVDVRTPVVDGDHDGAATVAHEQPRAEGHGPVGGRVPLRVEELAAGRRVARVRIAVIRSHHDLTLDRAVRRAVLGCFAVLRGPKRGDVADGAVRDGVRLDHREKD